VFLPTPLDQRLDLSASIGLNEKTLLEAFSNPFSNVFLVFVM
jgi:hypothetical protein